MTVFQSLDLNSRELSLASETSSLSLKEKLIFDLISEKINTGSADLRLEGGIRMSAGEILSSGGTIALSLTSENYFQNDAVMILDRETKEILKKHELKTLKSWGVSCMYFVVNYDVKGDPRKDYFYCF